MEKFDLLAKGGNGGCSAKLDPEKLKGLLGCIPLLSDPNILVDIQTHDDAGVYRLNDETALIVTTDFFPPMCSDAMDFGRIAAANALSDVYAMGGRPLLALNLNMFPSSQLPMSVLADILKGGQEKINESGAFTMGGHTIDDDTPKYGLAVVGSVHPDRLITNSGLKAGQTLILTKALGTGILLAAHRCGLASSEDLQHALDSMMQLNAKGAEVMQSFGVSGATDITGFGLLGHAMQMAKASEVCLEIEAAKVPSLANSLEALEEGCIPGACLRNLNYTENELLISPTVTTAQKLLLCDAQTSGGLFFGVAAEEAEAACQALIGFGYEHASIIGKVSPKRARSIRIL